MAGTENTRRISVSTYPVAWKIELVTDEIHSGHEYVRLVHCVICPTGTAHRYRTLAFIGGPQTRFGIYRTVLAQGLDFERYQEMLTERFHHSGGILGCNTTLSLVHLEVDPYEG